MPQDASLISNRPRPDTGDDPRRRAEAARGIQAASGSKAVRNSGLYDPSVDKSSCGVGFITRKDGIQSHEVIEKAHEALCVIPHRGGMSSEGVGDGAGVCVDLSVDFFRKITGHKTLDRGSFAVANFFMPDDAGAHPEADRFIRSIFEKFRLPVLALRDVPVNFKAIRRAARPHQLAIRQWVIAKPDDVPGNNRTAFDAHLFETLNAIETEAFSAEQFKGLYPLSLSARTQVYKGRLMAREVIPYFTDLMDPDHRIHSIFFHTRFSTNTAPHPIMAQPFRHMAHNGELNTDKKNRLSEQAIARMRGRAINAPEGQSDSARLDQTLGRRLVEDGLDIVTAVVAMMPPAWENDPFLSKPVRDMLEYFSLYEEKNDGPAAIIFGDGTKIGARLDRLGLRPLRSIETDDYLCVTSEAGQIEFDPNRVIRRGRIPAGGMICFDHKEGRSYDAREVLEKLASEVNYSELLEKSRIRIDDLPDPEPDHQTPSPEIPGPEISGPEISGSEIRGCDAPGWDAPDSEDPTLGNPGPQGLNCEKPCSDTSDPPTHDQPEDQSSLSLAQKYMAYALNQESFKFLLDPMIQTGAEKISAMGYGSAINALSDHEGGIARFLSQRFAQVTNPPLDSLREADGMTLRVALGAKPSFNCYETKQIILASPILEETDLKKITTQKDVPVTLLDSCYDVAHEDYAENAQRLLGAIDAICDTATAFARDKGGIIVVSDEAISPARAPLPGLLVVTAINQRLIEAGLRFSASLVLKTGQIGSSHHIAVALGFGASAVAPINIYWRAAEKFPDTPEQVVRQFIRAADKSLMKTMAKVGLCTVESYIGGEFFEPNFLNVEDPVLRHFFPNMVNQVGGVGFETIARNAADWHKRALEIRSETEIPLLGLFKERMEGAGHSYGTAAIRGFVEMTEEKLVPLHSREAHDTHQDTPIHDKHGAGAVISGDRADRAGADEGVSDRGGAGAEPSREDQPDSGDTLRLLTIEALEDAYGMSPDSYRETSFDQLTASEIDNFTITKRYRDFIRTLGEERHKRPAALRDILDFPIDINYTFTEKQFYNELKKHALYGNNVFCVRGLDCRDMGAGRFSLHLTGSRASEHARLSALKSALLKRFGDQILWCKRQKDGLTLEAIGEALFYFSHLRSAPGAIALDRVEPASRICKSFASGAMSHGALVAPAHEAVAHGTNMVGGYSNSGEGGEHFSRYDTIRASRIKQLASGRFGVWAGYLADPMLEELEIKIAQGAKPGEGGQLPAPKVTVEIAAARGGTPGVELVSPPPHHDTYSIEDLAQLIHDAKAARVRVIVKLVSSEGIGTIAVGVAKAGADIINIAGNTGGTGAAAVTSLKNTGRAAEIGLAEVHQALCINGIRQKVLLRCSGAHQTASDVVKSALLGADSFEFGTTALMMLKCVMAKNCNVKCPAGLTTNPEVFDGDPRSLAQYLANVAHETREILASLGLASLAEARGRSDLLQLLDHPSVIGSLDVRALLHHVEEVLIDNPVYLEADFSLDEELSLAVKQALFTDQQASVTLEGETGGISHQLTNRYKTVCGQLAIDLERCLQYELTPDEAEAAPAVRINDRGRRYLDAETIKIVTSGSAGQSFGAFCNDGMILSHRGTCNDGVGKGQSGGIIAISSPGGGLPAEAGGNVLIGNFALFGATGGTLYVEGEAGDRFAVRNSGTCAVVEGVGDFACEYMTNGTVLNLGSFGKGFCNGMSGGFAYQYDPHRTLSSSYSTDSVILENLTNGSEEAEIHEAAILGLLEGHIAHTGSQKARDLLESWQTSRAHFVYATPRVLAAYQNADKILEDTPRKALIEELATALCLFQISKFKIAYRDGRNILDDTAPGPLQNTPARDNALLNAYTVHYMAGELARTRLRNVNAGADEIQSTMRKLILTEDYSLLQQLTKYARGALGQYSDEELAILISNKRITDYKSALAARNALSMNSPGTYGWILHQDRLNRRKMENLPDFETLFAKEATLDIAKKAS